MEFNLFNWIREGVRRSVMLGVADAIDSVGTPPTGQDLQKSLVSFRSKIESPLEPALTSSNAAGRGTPTRKRLGRTLKDIDTAK